uniref:BTB domain-containing protein n=1 Tax=Panagrolaimus davidi TaxID=227884 RepID=A0A914PVL8_9BILA
MECVIAAEWIIDEKDLQKIIEVDDAGLRSPNFELIDFLDCYYRFILFRHSTDESKIVVYLMQSIEADVQFKNAAAKLTISIPSANYSEPFEHVFPRLSQVDDDWIGSAIPREYFFNQKYLKDGKLTLHFRGTLTFGKKHGIQHQQNIGKLLWDDTEKDFTIEAEGREIKAHKFILRQRSPYFVAMLENQWKEAKGNKVEMKFPFKIVETGVKICYDFQSYYFLTDDELLVLLKFADYGQISHVKTYTESCLADIMTPTNVCVIAKASTDFNATELRACCMDYLLNYDYQSSTEYNGASDFPGCDSLDPTFKNELHDKSCQ